MFSPLRWLEKGDERQKFSILRHGRRVTVEKLARPRQNVRELLIGAYDTSSKSEKGGEKMTKAKGQF